jgi:hypothetical protein
MEHRAEYAEWEVRRDNATLGYKTENKEWIESRVDPAPQLKEKMIFNKRPPEGDPEPVLEQPVVGNTMAEESLLAVAMYDPAAIPVVQQLSPKEFSDPLNRRVAEIVVSHYQTNDPTDWDSSYPLGDVDRTQYGLQRWENNAGVIENAKHYAGEIRNQYRASQTLEIVTWGQQQMLAQIDVGVSPKETDQLHRTVKNKLGLVEAPLPTDQILPPHSDWPSPILSKGPLLTPYKRSIGTLKTSHPLSRART